MISTLLPTTHLPSLLPDLQGRPPRVVIDTAVLVTALMFGGGPAALLRSAWKSGRCRPMACKATALHLGAQLAHPQLGLTHQEQRQLLGDYLPYVLKVRVPQADTPAAQDDPPGLAQVRLAMAGRAHALVSGEAPMLALGERLPFAVLALQTFVDQLGTLAVTPIPKPRHH